MKNTALIIIFSILVLTTRGQTLQTVTNNGSTTSNPISISTGAEGLALVGNSYLSFKDIDGSGRNGYIKHDGNDLMISADLGTIRLYGRVGIGAMRAYDPSTLHIKALTSSPWAFLTEAKINRRIIGINHTGNEGVIAVSYLDDAGFTPLQFWTSNIPRMTISTDGNIGIGTTSPKEKLSVNGKIRAQEIKVETSNWPDYVFAKDYVLPTLAETEKHIKEKGHLQGIPSATEVKENGVELGEMNKLLLKKVEELTLHLIEKEKDILLEKTINEAQENRILLLEKNYKRLEKIFKQNLK
ncbi:hypothetical protein [Pedobacter nototheniae]|uniref:hypothetical protein n=1 Tax=Pedobacter nototheniae TaxID=2488994 RepID=UPI0010406004|nr:hypothetical protein [Pedobacter nototheniae]